MKKLTYFISSLFLGLLFVLGFASTAKINAADTPEVTLQYQFDTDYTQVRFIGTITNVTDENKLDNAKITLIATNTKDITLKKYYTSVTNGDTVLKAEENNTYYFVYRLTDISTYAGNSLTAKLTVTYDGKDYGSATRTVDLINGTVSVSEVEGYTEGAYTTFACASTDAASDYTVSYAEAGSDSYTAIDSELIRKTDSTTIRADILGLPAGKYDIKVATSDKKKETITNDVKVTEDDRSGYAHFNYTSGIGAYNDDGSLKSTAVVVYVTDATKNTVTATIGGKNYTGIANILKSGASVPLCVRILDEIKTNQWNSKSCEPRLTDDSNLQSDTFWVNTMETTYGDNLAGLIVQYMDKKLCQSTKYTTTVDGLSTPTTGSSSAKTTTYSKTEYANITGNEVYDDDSYWNMLDISFASNITVEGVGEDAEIFQWGFTWKSCNSIEIKNLEFTDYPEDACSFEGSSNDTVTTVGNYWVHNCTFNIGKNNWDVSGERDKAEGDGSMDLKFCHSITQSYCQFNKCHKTGLVGGSEANLTMNVTYHNNYYNQVQSRLPLGRQANMHIYNNYYYKCSSCIDLRASAYAYSEYNYFDGCTKAMILTTKKGYSDGVIKSYNDHIEGTSQATVVSSREDSVTSTCKPDGSTSYTNFDTNSTLFYYDSTNKKSDVMLMIDTADVPTYIPQWAGAGKLVQLPITDEDTIYYTVTFELNGGTGTTTKTVADGSKLSVADPTRDGYTFAGWYTDSELTSAFTSSTAITKDITLYAKWTKVVTYTITYVLNGGTGSSSEIVNSGSTIQSSNPTQSGYKFEGWYTDSGLTSKFDTSTAITKDITLYAKWTEVTSETLTFTTGATGDNKEFFTVTNGNLKSGISSKIYDGVTYTAALKMESTTSIAFTTTSSMTITLITDTVSKSIYIDGNKYTTDSDGVYTMTLAAGSHTITKGDSINLYAIILN